MGIRGKPCEHIDEEISHTAVAGMLDLGDIFKLIVDGFDDGALAQQQLIDQWHELVFHVQNSYMDPPRFARPSFVCDKKKVATIYPACLRGHIAAGPDEFRAS